MEQKLYGGSVTVKFSEGKAVRYQVNDKPTSSVTSVTGLLEKPGLKFWSAGLACDYITDAMNRGEEITQQIIDEARTAFQRQSKEAADLGSQIHAWCEDYINSLISTGTQPTLPDKSDPRFNGVLAFLRWKDEHGVKFVSSERIVYSKQHDFVGRCDAEAIVDGKHCLIDFKTSNAKKDGGVYSEWKLQTAAYQKALEEEGVKFDGPRMIARFDKTSGTPEIYILEDVDKDFAAFLGLLAVKRREQEL